MLQFSRSFKSRMAGYARISGRLCQQLLEAVLFRSVRGRMHTAAKARARTFVFDFPATSLGPSFW